MKLMRKKLGFSTQQLADLAQVSRSMIYKIENETTQPSLDVAVRIAKALNVSLTTMLGESENSIGPIIHKAAQPEWQDPNTGLIRRSLIPQSFNNEWLRISLPKNSQTGMIPALVNKSGYLYMLSGKAFIDLSNGESLKISSGDLFIIPNNIEHNVRNSSEKVCDFFILLPEYDNKSR